MENIHATWNFLRTYLNSLSVACTQERQEDSCDGDMVTWLGKTSVFTTCVHRHTPWNISNRHLVTLYNIRRNS